MHIYLIKAGLHCVILAQTDYYNCIVEMSDLEVKPTAAMYFVLRHKYMCSTCNPENIYVNYSDLSLLVQ